MKILEEDPKQAEIWRMGNSNLIFTGLLRAPTADRRQKTSSQQSSDLRERKWPCGLTEGLMDSYGGESPQQCEPRLYSKIGKVLG